MSGKPGSNGTAAGNGNSNQQSKYAMVKEGFGSMRNLKESYGFDSYGEANAFAKKLHSLDKEGGSNSQKK